MRHYVLTRSAYGPAWDREANRRRLAITEAVTLPLLAAQAVSWTWIVLLDPRDPFRKERLRAYRQAAPDLIVLWRNGADELDRSRSAAADYRADWRDAIGPADDQILMTRLDDDDGLAPDALARYQAAARRTKTRTALMFPMGIRIWNGRYTLIRHDQNAMHTLVTQPGDTMCVYDYGHTKVHNTVPVVTVDRLVGWLWVRHRDTISGWRKAARPISNFVRESFPIDWPALEAAWRH